mgnify:CR=1 FL=1|tara:strand:- start:128 stop:373 length:246 start_codon:yes stop_codon:yes gene_type:complete
MKQFIAYLMSNVGDCLPSSNGNGFCVFGLKENYDLSVVQTMAETNGLRVRVSEASDEYPEVHLWIGKSKLNDVDSLLSSVA